MKKNSSILVNKNTITSIAIGGFDGMHKAHQELFKRLDKNGAIVVIQTGYANLTPKSYRQEYSHFPIYYYILDNIKHLEGEEFIKLLKEEFINLKKIVIGFDFRFGKNRKYDSEDLKEFFKGKIEVIPEIKINNVAVHSRYIRDFIQKGEIQSANRFLGKEYKIYGKQIKGQGLGEKSFVPTINVSVEKFLLPKNGVYITKTILDNKEYDSISFIGHRKTTDNKFSIETYILHKDIIYKEYLVQIKFLLRLRDNFKFDTYEKLKEQILKDIERAKEYFIK